MRQSAHPPAGRLHAATSARWQPIKGTGTSNVAQQRCRGDVRCQAAKAATYISGAVTGALVDESSEVLVIDGNVTKRGSVQAVGSVVVTGSIAGMVHAGCHGSRAATIRARCLLTDKLAVADAVGLSPEARRQIANAPASSMVRLSAEGQLEGLRVDVLGPALAPSNAWPDEDGEKHAAAAEALRAAPGRAAAFTGGYAILAGLALTIAPRATFGLLFDAADVTTGWIRVGGILFTLIGMQYLGTSELERRGEGVASFYHASVWSRAYLVVGFLLLVATGQSSWGLALLAAINAVGALLMLRALVASRPAGAAR